MIRIPTSILCPVSICDFSQKFEHALWLCEQDMGSWSWLVSCKVPRRLEWALCFFSKFCSGCPMKQGKNQIWKLREYKMGCIYAFIVIHIFFHSLQRSNWWFFILKCMRRIESACILPFLFKTNAQKRHKWN